MSLYTHIYIIHVFYIYNIYVIYFWVFFSLNILVCQYIQIHLIFSVVLEYSLAWMFYDLFVHFPIDGI